MLIKRINKKIRNRIIVGLLIFVSTFGGLLEYKHQQAKIEDLQHKLEMKQDKDNKDKGMYSTVMDAQNIKMKFNETNSYKIFSGEVNLKHKYEYTRDKVLGFKSHGVLTANAKAYYEYEINLKDADVSVEGNTINIILPKAKLNKDSVHMVNNTFKIIEKETRDNLLMNEYDGKMIQRYWIETFSTSAIEQIETYYDGSIMQDKLSNEARREVKLLIDTLGINETNVKINIK